MKTPAPPTRDRREERERQLARAVQIRRVGKRWAVPSQSVVSELYLVSVEDAACTCPDYELRRGTCKHQHAVLYWIAWGRDVDADGNVTETATAGVTTKPRRRTYQQKDWSAYDASQVHERESPRTSTEKWLPARSMSTSASFVRDGCHCR